MLTQDFYKAIDTELLEILEKYKNDPYLKKYHKSPHNQKSYALLIWFLQFYGRIFNYIDYITEGENDSSCDIVFDKKDSQGNQIFYIVQSKWNNDKNAERETDRDEILKTLNEFETILRGEKKNVNDKLKEKLEELDAHLKSNGEVKCIFLSLAQYKGGADENIQTFRNNDVKVKFEIIDINRIRVDYIDRKYKKIDPVNPLETYQSPEETPIQLDIVQNGGSIKIDRPYEAYVFLIRPKTVWELFKQYNFALFFKNVRNPLIQSQFNQDIEKTALEESNLFWYYNNGITAITSLLPEVGAKAETIEVIGLQIINGAQTVYSIYRAYEKASKTQRLKMDSEALITLRLLKSGGTRFDLNVTRYTNSQNPVQDRDFFANDDIQIRLQNASFQTKFWYEKRRGEFREVPEGIKVISNSEFASVYLAYHLQNPVGVLEYGGHFGTEESSLFLSHKDHKNGLYEDIFHEKLKFEDILIPLYISNVIDKISESHPYWKSFNGDDSIQYSFTNFALALSKIVLSKYFRAKYGIRTNINIQVKKLYENQDVDLFVKVYDFIITFFETLYSIEDLYAISSSQYEQIRGELERKEITLEMIE